MEVKAVENRTKMIRNTTPKISSWMWWTMWFKMEAVNRSNNDQVQIHLNQIISHLHHSRIAILDGLLSLKIKIKRIINNNSFWPIKRNNGRKVHLPFKEEAMPKEIKNMKTLEPMIQISHNNNQVGKRAIIITWQERTINIRITAINNRNNIKLSKACDKWHLRIWYEYKLKSYFENKWILSKAI